MMGVTALLTAILMATMVIPPGGLWGPVPGASPAAPSADVALPLAEGPRSTTDLATVNPSATLTPDEHDVTIAASSLEARKSTGESHEHHAAQEPEPAAPAVHHHHVEPEPEPAKRAEAPAKKPAATKPAATKPAAKKPAAEKPAAAVVYTCPMHPEVTSSTPGNCPKCGMSLVKKAPKK